MRSKLRQVVGSVALVTACAAAVVGCGKKRVSDEVAAEAQRREQSRMQFLRAEDAGRAAGVSSRPDVFFEDGFSKLFYDPPDDYRNHAFRWMGWNAHVRLKRHGDKRMKLRVLGWANNKVLHSWPTLAGYVNGVPVGEAPPMEKAHYWLEADIDPAMFNGEEWADLNLLFSTVAYHWSEPPNLMVGLVYRFDWEELP